MDNENPNIMTRSLETQEPLDESNLTRNMEMLIHTKERHDCSMIEAFHDSKQRDMQMTSFRDKDFHLGSNV